MSSMDSALLPKLEYFPSIECLRSRLRPSNDGRFRVELRWIFKVSDVIF